MKKKTGFFSVIKITLTDFFKFAPILTGLIIILSLFSAGSNSVIIIVRQVFFDKAYDLSIGNAAFQAVVLALLLYGAVIILTQVAGAANNLLSDAVFQKVQRAGYKKIHDKIARLSCENFEDPKKLDKISNAERGMQGAVWNTFTVLSFVFFYIPYFVFVSWYLFLLNPILVLSIVLIFIPSALTQLINLRVDFNVNEKVMPLQRKYTYYEKCMNDREFYKETRLLGGYFYFVNLYTDILKIVRSLCVGAKIKKNLLLLAAKLLSAAGYAFIVVMLVSTMLGGNISVGEFATILAALDSLYKMMEEIVIKRTYGIVDEYGKMIAYVDFLKFPEEKRGILDKPVNTDIILKDVSYSYINAKENALSGIDLTIKKGEIVAVVGENGSGKTTLIRLLCGLYEKKSGDILYGDTKIEDIKNIYDNSSFLFQRFSKYQLTLRDNVNIADISNPDDDKTNACLNNADIYSKDNMFAKGLDTLLSKEFGGTDISGGEWQRLAAARAYYKPHNLIIMDEPTSAIDPLEETKLYDRFKTACIGKTAIVITHRLGLVKIADRVIVLKNGRIEEEGTHGQLMKKNGEYKRMYEAQREMYNN